MDRLEELDKGVDFNFNMILAENLDLARAAVAVAVGGANKL